MFGEQDVTNGEIANTVDHTKEKSMPGQIWEQREQHEKEMRGWTEKFEISDMLMCPYTGLSLSHILI